MEILSDASSHSSRAPSAQLRSLCVCHACVKVMVDLAVWYDYFPLQLPRTPTFYYWQEEIV